MSKKGDCYNNAPNQMAEDFYKLPAWNLLSKSVLLIQQTSIPDKPKSPKQRDKLSL